MTQWRHDYDPDDIMTEKPEPRDAAENRRRYREAGVAKLAGVGMLAALVVWWQVDFIHAAVLFVGSAFVFGSVCFYAGNRQFTRQADGQR
jgi:hypothetical protein